MSKPALIPPPPPPPPEPPPPANIPELSNPATPLPGPRMAPWERLPGESETDYARFQAYTEDGGTIKALSEKLDLSYQHVGRIAARNRWRARREALYAQRRSELRREIRSSTKEQADAMVEGWTSCLEWALASVAHHQAAGTLLNPRDATSMLKATTEALRLINGEPSAHVKHDVSGLSLEKLDELDRMLGSIEEDPNG